MNHRCEFCGKTMDQPCSVRNAGGGVYVRLAAYGEEQIRRIIREELVAIFDRPTIVEDEKHRGGRNCGDAACKRCTALLGGSR